MRICRFKTAPAFCQRWPNFSWLILFFRPVKITYLLAERIRSLTQPTIVMVETTVNDYMFYCCDYQKMQFDCSDVRQAFLKVIGEKVPHALDRFQVLQKMSKAIDQLRAAEARQMKEDGYKPLLTGSRWLTPKRPGNLSEKSSGKLTELLHYDLKRVRSHLMKEDYQMFCTSTYPAWAGKCLES